MKTQTDTSHEINAKYQFIEELLKGKLLLVSTQGQEGAIFGTFSGFSDHINLGLCLKNAYGTSSMSVYTHVVAGSVEMRNKCFASALEHSAEIVADKDGNRIIQFTTTGTTGSSTECVCLHQLIVRIMGTARD